MIAWLTEALIASTGLMLLVFAIREPVRRSFGARAAYALWLLPVLRMVLPPLDLIMPAAAQVNVVTQATGALGDMVRDEMVQQLSVAPAVAPVAEAAPVWPMLLAGAWILGLILFAIGQCIAYRRFCGFILSEATLRDEIEPGIFLLDSARVKGPMAFGLRRRFIVFPLDAEKRFDAEERAMALQHELAHHLRGDLVANAVALVMLCLHWCNPVAWLAYRAFRNDQEMACDADVIEAVRGSHLGHAYGRALVKSASGREFAAACNLTTVDRLKRRLAMLSSKSLSARRRRTGLLLTGAVVLCGLALTASGEGMAAQVGAKVSEAIPLPRMAEMLPQMEAAHASVAARAAGQAEAQAERAAARAERQAAQAEHDAERMARLAEATEGELALADLDLPVPPAPPAPPALPAVGAVPVPPLPPAPPAPPRLDDKGPHHVYRVYRGPAGHVPSAAEINAMVPDIRTTQDCKPGDGVVKREESTVQVDGKSRTKVKLLICAKPVDVTQARAHSLESMKRARARLVEEQARSEKRRAEAIAQLDKSIAEMEAKKD